MLDSGAGASVCSPNDFPNIAIDTKTAVTKVYRCAEGRELRVYGYKWIRLTILDVLRPIVALSCLVQCGWDLSFGGAPVEATATHRATQRRLGLVQRVGLYFIPLLIAAHQTQHARGHVICNFEEDVAGDGVERHEHAFHESGEGVDQPEQDQQEPTLGNVLTDPAFAARAGPTLEQVQLARDRGLLPDPMVETPEAASEVARPPNTAASGAARSQSAASGAAASAVSGTASQLQRQQETPLGGLRGSIDEEDQATHNFVRLADEEETISTLWGSERLSKTGEIIDVAVTLPLGRNAMDYSNISAEHY
eukprot:6491827-Amphidinium_carterae.1